MRPGARLLSTVVALCSVLLFATSFATAATAPTPRAGTLVGAGSHRALSYAYDARAADTTITTHSRAATLIAERDAIRVPWSSTSLFLPRSAAKEIPEFVGPVRESSDAIANGHAFAKHVLKKGEFPEVSSPDDLARIVERVRTHGEFRQLSNGRRAYYDPRDNTVVIRNPKDPDAGTVFRPDNGRDYFDNELK